MRTKTIHIESYLCLFEKRPESNRFFPLDCFDLRRKGKAVYMYSLAGIINTLARVASMADSRRKRQGNGYQMSTYQVRDRQGAVWAEVRF